MEDSFSGGAQGIRCGLGEKLTWPLRGEGHLSRVSPVISLTDERGLPLLVQQSVASVFLFSTPTQSLQFDVRSSPHSWVLNWTVLPPPWQTCVVVWVVY